MKSTSYVSYAAQEEEKTLNRDTKVAGNACMFLTQFKIVGQVKE